MATEFTLPIKRKGSHSPPAKVGKTESCNCPACGKPADSGCIECDWCGLWEHSECSGLSSEDLQVLSKLPSSVMFFCTVCQPKVSLAFKFFNDIQENHKALDTKLKQLEEKVDQHIKKGEKLVHETLASQTPVSDTTPVPVNKTPTTAPRLSPSDRGCNVVIYGIKENPSGTKRSDRQKTDFDNIIHTLSSANVPVQASSIRDFYRLGKFNPDQSRPRPILIKFLRVFDAEAVLSKRSNLRAPIVIKHDMTKEERYTESLLLRERWNLVQKGIERKFIKIRNSQIFVNNQLHGSVQGSRFQARQSNNSASSSNSPPADQSQMEQDTPAN